MSVVNVLEFLGKRLWSPPQKNCSAFEFIFLIIFTYIFNLIYNFWSRRGKKGVLGNLMNMFLHLYWGNGYRLFLFIRGFLTKKVNFYSISIKIKKNTYSRNILISVEKIEKPNKIILKKHIYSAKHYGTMIGTRLKHYGTMIGTRLTKLSIEFSHC